MIDSNMVRGENGAWVLGNSTASAADGRFSVSLGEATPVAAPSPSGSTPVTFYIVRHGQTEYNLKHLVQGWCDAPLTEAGVRDARACGRGLAPRRHRIRGGLLERFGTCRADDGRAALGAQRGGA